MPNFKNPFQELSGAAEPEAGEEHIKDLEFEVTMARRFHRPLIRTVGLLVASEAVMTAHDAVLQQQGLTPENALGAAGVIAGTMAVRGLSRMVGRRAEAAAQELQTLEAAAEAERILQAAAITVAAGPETGQPPIIPELAEAA